MCRSLRQRHKVNPAMQLSAQLRDHGMGLHPIAGRSGAPRNRSARISPGCPSGPPPQTCVVPRDCWRPRRTALRGKRVLFWIDSLGDRPSTESGVRAGRRFGGLGVPPNTPVLRRSIGGAVLRQPQRTGCPITRSAAWMCRRACSFFGTPKKCPPNDAGAVAIAIETHAGQRLPAAEDLSPQPVREFAAARTPASWLRRRPPGAAGIAGGKTVPARNYRNPAVHE